MILSSSSQDSFSISIAKTSKSALKYQGFASQELTIFFACEKTAIDKMCAPLVVTKVSRFDR